MAKKKTKVITRTVYKPIIEDNIKEKARIKEEIKELEDKRGKLGKGFGNFLAKMSLNKTISEKNKLINQSDKIKIIKAQTEYGRALLEKEKVKAELKGLRQKTQINTEDLFGEVKKTNNNIYY